MREYNFEYTIGSDPNFEDLVADIGFNSHLVALLTQEGGFQNLRIRLFPPENLEYWDFRFDEFEEILQKAKNRLSELRKEE